MPVWPQELIVRQQPGTIDIHMPAGVHSTHWLRYRMQNRSMPDIRSDVWRCNEIWETKQSSPMQFEPVRLLVTRGEIELAVRQRGKSDFMGGTMHGDEEKTGFSLNIDGESVDPDADKAYHAQCVEFHQDSNLLEADKSERIPLAHVRKHWHFSSDGLQLDTRIEWLEAIELEAAYLAMFPLARQNEYGVISTSGFRDPDWEEEDLSTPQFSMSYTPAARAIALGPEGLKAEVQILSGWDKPMRKFNFSNSVHYNKFYFDFTGPGYNTRPGEIMEASARFSLILQHNISCNSQKPDQGTLPELLHS